MRKLAIAATLALAASAVVAQTPRILHATLTTAPAAADLGAQVRAATTTWIGYSVPAVDGYRVSCDRCRLGDDNVSFTRNDDDLRPAAGNLAVVYRVENGAIAKVRAYSAGCVLDASGTTVSWIEGVDPRRSVALLASLLGGERRLGNRAMSALALHADPAAGEQLETWSRSTTVADETRGEAVFGWPRRARSAGSRRRALSCVTPPRRRKCARRPSSRCRSSSRPRRPTS